MCMDKTLILCNLCLAIELRVSTNTMSSTSKNIVAELNKGE